MTGKTHYQLGIVTGMTAVLAMGVHTTIFGAEIITLISVAGSAVGAILPDCDIRTSKAGKIYKNISGIFLLIGCFCLGVSIMSYFYESELIKGLSALLSVLGAGCVLFYTGMRSVKHRGVTHCFLIPTFLCGLFALLIYINPRITRELSITALSFLFGIIIGYLSHLFADMFNPKGIPIFYPSRFMLSLMKINTGSKTERVWFWIASAAMLTAGCFRALR